MRPLWTNVHLSWALPVHARPTRAYLKVAFIFLGSDFLLYFPDFLGVKLSFSIDWTAGIISHHSGFKRWQITSGSCTSILTTGHYSLFSSTCMDFASWGSNGWIFASWILALILSMILLWTGPKLQAGAGSNMDWRGKRRPLCLISSSQRGMHRVES